MSVRDWLSFAASVVAVTVIIAPVYGQESATFDELWITYLPGAPTGTGSDQYAPETLTFDLSHPFNHTYGDFSWTNTVSLTGTVRTFGGKRPGAAVSIGASASGPTDLAIGSNDSTRGIVNGATTYVVDVRPLPGVTQTRQVPMVFLMTGVVNAFIVGYGYADSGCSARLEFPAWTGMPVDASVWHACGSGISGFSCTQAVATESFRARVSKTVPVASNQATRIRIYLTCRSEVAAEIFNQSGAGGAAANGFVDPIIYIDPTWPFAADYELAFSPNGIEPAGVPGNCNGDSDVDLNDYALEAGCMHGPSVTAAEGSCTCFDIDDDGDVDLSDFAEMQIAMTGSLP